MACDSGCGYDCKKRPNDLCPYSDISGIGVLVGYTATAGIVVLILVFHYYLAHDPTKDPFHRESVVESRNSRPNPIDVVHLSSSSRALAWLRLRRHLQKAKTYPRLEAFFIKCVQSMSDLQILTGTSILISGYVQLRCGISAFHWQIIVLLAWFSSITHLSCLTFLRNHLYNRPAERVLRLVAMGLMMLMLLVAMVPTGGYDWSFYGYSDATSYLPAPSDYAICYFRPAINDERFAFSTMVISVLLLTLAFIHRVIRLHRPLSIIIVGRVRIVCSEKSRHILRLVYTKLDLETSGLTFKRIFLYRPLLALFLTVRAFLDLWNSMFIEVLWMVGSFSWGLIRLLRTLQMEDRGFSDWSFGQVVPLVLLAAPLLTIFESFYTVHQPNNTVSTALMQFHTSYSEFDHDNSLSNTPLQARDHPDQDFYQNSSWAHSLIHLMVAFAIGETTWILTLGSLGDYNFLRFVIPKDPTFFSSLVSYFPIYITLCIWILIMVLILLEDIGCAPGNVLRSFIGIPRKTYILGGKVFLFGSSVAGSILSWTVPEFGGIIPSSLFCLFSNAVLYCVLSAVVHLTTVRHGYAFL